MRAASLSRGLGCIALSLTALGCAGNKSTVVPAPGSEINDPAAGFAKDAPDAASSDAAASSSDSVAAADSSAQLDRTPTAVDPAVAHALVAKSGDAAGHAPLGLRFEVIELGAELPWAFAVVNRGTEAALVDFDARLITLEIQPPTPEPQLDAKGKPMKAPKPPKPVVCRLPAGVVPSSVDAALQAKLEPGEGLVQNFDPRLYCIGKPPWPLVQGATVSARFGWAPKMKVGWHAGKREENLGTQSEPFVAEPSEAEGSLPNAERAQAAESERRIKELVGTPLTLAADFGVDPPLPPGAIAAAPGLELSLGGSDASNEGSVTATTTITNRGKKKEQIYFRRELITYEVSGPDGVFQCDPEPDKRSPADRSAVQTLGFGGKLSAVSRLIEMCPAKAFARPGLYLVHARFDAADPATDLGFHAFMGRLVSKKPALVRVREGELPFTPPSGAMRVHVGE